VPLLKLTKLWLWCQNRIQLPYGNCKYLHRIKLESSSINHLLWFNPNPYPNRCFKNALPRAYLHLLITHRQTTIIEKKGNPNPKSHISKSTLPDSRYKCQSTSSFTQCPSYPPGLEHKKLCPNEGIGCPTNSLPPYQFSISSFPPHCPHFGHFT
jgi:hypothetical protein